MSGIIAQIKENAAKFKGSVIALELREIGLLLLSLTAFIEQEV